MEPDCDAQDALLKVHARIVEEDHFGGMVPDDDNENNVVTARLLFLDNMVGCLLGKCGDVIQRLQIETGVSICVLPADHLPTCGMSTDELVHVI
uniref:KH domain-containing protein At4g18375-like n=1 Tax=Rhizophora mucronata TaxID=61149 RepID=A0A2P2K3C6_RHIMU